MPATPAHQPPMVITTNGETFQAKSLAARSGPKNSRIPSTKNATEVAAVSARLTVERLSGAGGESMARTLLPRAGTAAWADRAHRTAGSGDLRRHEPLNGVA